MLLLKRELAANGFEAFEQPRTLLGVSDMHELDTNRGAVHLLEVVDHLAQGHLRWKAHA